MTIEILIAGGLLMAIGFIVYLTIPYGEEHESEIH
tara:strand:+ start:527 stop:631 length:105 start_codon:yes stop_codon:yes gene_type:complete